MASDMGYHCVGIFRLPDTAQITRIALRLLVAAILGGILGYERERLGKSAGVRTHMLVTIGSALFVLIPQQAGTSTADMSRVLQGVIAGVGFLGAGSIVSGNTQLETRGLTTAAGIWVTAAIGVAVGLGRESTGNRDRDARSRKVNLAGSAAFALGSFLQKKRPPREGRPFIYPRLQQPTTQ